MQKLIVYLTPYYPPYGAGGAEWTTSRHAAILARSGQDVLVVTPDFGGGPSDTIDGVEIVRVPGPGSLGLGEQVSRAVFDDPTFQEAFAKAAKEALRGRAVACVHAQHSAVVAAGAMVTKTLGVPFIAHLRDTLMVCSFGGPCLLEQGTEEPPEKCSLLRHARCHFSRRVPLVMPEAAVVQQITSLWQSRPPYDAFRSRRLDYAEADRIAVNSQGLLDIYAAMDEFQDPGRMKVLYPPALAPDSNGPEAPLPPEVAALKDAGHPIILYVGKLSPGKGSDVMFAAHRKLLELRPDAYLVVCGNAHGRQWDMDGKRVVFMGFIERNVIESLYKASDIGIVPSTWPEPLGSGTIDAGRHAKPIVATRVGGTPEAIIHGKTGLLVEKLDVGGMADAMEQLLSDPGRAAEMGRQGREHVMARFGEAAVLQQLNDLYQGFAD